MEQCDLEAFTGHREWTTPPARPGSSVRPPPSPGHLIPTRPEIQHPRAKFNTKFNNLFFKNACFKAFWKFNTQNSTRNSTHQARNSTPKGEIQHEIQQPVFSKTLVLKRFRKSTNEIQHEIQQCIWVPCCELLEAHTCVHVDGSATPRNKAPTTPQ